MIIAIVGKTNSGKDTAAQYIHDTYNIPFVVSATTRPMRDYETDGREHWFISKEEMEELKARDDVLAYTINDKTGIEYAATLKDIPEGSDCIYIINPEGIRWLNRYGPKGIDISVIYIDCDEKTIIHRGIHRGDNPEVLWKRLDSERTEFNAYKANGDYDYLVDNNGDKDYMLAQIDEVASHLRYIKRRISKIKTADPDDGSNRRP